MSLPAIRLCVHARLPETHVITTYVAWQQWKTNQRKFNLDRYDRRLKVYQETLKFIQIVCRDAKVNLSDLFEFYMATAEADFLFSPDIRDYLDELFSRANELNTANTLYRDYTMPPQEGYDHKAVCESMHKETVWFLEQPKIALKKFKVFLDVSK